MLALCATLSSLAIGVAAQSPGAQAAALSRPPAPAAAAAADPGRPSLSAPGVAAVLASSDLVWSWNAEGVAGALDPLAPVSWSQGAYTGNGLLGAMLTAARAGGGGGGATPSLRVDVSRTDVWECAQREPLAYLTLTPAASPLARVAARLELASGALRVNLTLASGAVVRLTLRVGAAGDGRAGGPGGALVLTAATVGDAGAGAPLVISATADSSGPCSDASPAVGVAADGVHYITQRFRSGGTASVAYTVVATPPTGPPSRPRQPRRRGIAPCRRRR